MSSPIEVKVYKGKRQSDAAKDFAADAGKMVARGYVPVSQSWADGRSGCLRFIFLGGIGAIVLKPAGTLTVTYRLDPVAAGTQVSVAPEASAPASEPVAAEPQATEADAPPLDT